ncbi:MAG: hypothetical protein ACXQS8_06985 [Candidatus Helarchaeales archaeon]
MTIFILIYISLSIIFFLVVFLYPYENLLDLSYKKEIRVDASSGKIDLKKRDRIKFEDIIHFELIRTGSQITLQVATNQSKKFLLKTKSKRKFNNIDYVAQRISDLTQKKLLTINQVF